MKRSFETKHKIFNFTINLITRDYILYEASKKIHRMHHDTVIDIKGNPSTNQVPTEIESSY